MAYTDWVARTGRPPKPEGEKFIGKHLKFPPALWREVEETIPKRERTAFVRSAVEAALRRLKRKREERDA